MSDEGEENGMVLHVVQSGETLSRIAHQYGVDHWRDIYEHERNKEFRELRPDPNLIQPGDQIWIPVNGEEARATVGTGRDHKLNIRRANMALESITFESDHHVMHDNYMLNDTSVPEWARVDWGWSASGNKYSKPEWEGGKSAPVSQSQETKLRLELGLKVELKKGPPLKGRLVGEVENVSDGTFEFRSDPLEIDSGEHAITVSGGDALPDWPIRLADRPIKWTFRARQGTIDLGTSGPHTVLVSFDTPINRGEPEDGATRARMRGGTEWVRAMGKGTSVELIGRLFDQFDRYVLGYRYLSDEQKEAVRDTPHLKEYMTQVDWPAFLHSNAPNSDERLQEQGGAWPLMVLEDFGGECQAMVRFVRGILVQLGHEEGTIETMYVNASAEHPKAPIIRTYGTGCDGPRDDRGYALVDREVEVGKKYDVEGHAVGWNNFEAYLQYTYENDEGETMQAWYGGGIGLIKQPQREPLSDEFKKTLLFVFKGLAEFKIVREGTKRMREVTRYWPYREE